jgi:hypothetical protein
MNFIRDDPVFRFKEQDFFQSGREEYISSMINRAGCFRYKR